MSCSSDPLHLEATGLTREELQNYIAGGLVNVDLSTGKILWQRFLGITRVCDSSGMCVCVFVCVSVRVCVCG